MCTVASKPMRRSSAARAVAGSVRIEPESTATSSNTMSSSATGAWPSLGSIDTPGRSWRSQIEITCPAPVGSLATSSRLEAKRAPTMRGTRPETR